MLGLQRAIEEDDQEVVESCLPVLGVSCRLPGVGGPSPAMLAASLGRAAALAAVLDKGGICSYDERSGVTGLIALSSGDRGNQGEDVRCAELLVEAGEEVEAVSSQGITALMAAARAGKAALVAWLADRGALLDRRELQGWTALHFSVVGDRPCPSDPGAQDGGHGEVARLLLERGADPLLVTKDGQTVIEPMEGF